MFAHEYHRAHKRVVMTAVRQNGLALREAHPSLKADVDVVMAAVRQNGFALKEVDPSLKTDANVVMTAVRNAPMALLYSPMTFLLFHQDIVTCAVNRDRRAIVMLRCRASSSWPSHPRWVRAGPKHLTALFRCMPPYFTLPVEVVREHILPHYFPC